MQLPPTPQILYHPLHHAEPWHLHLCGQAHSVRILRRDAQGRKRQKHQRHNSGSALPPSPTTHHCPPSVLIPTTNGCTHDWHRDWHRDWLCPRDPTTCCCPHVHTLFAHSPLPLPSLPLPPSLPSTPSSPSTPSTPSFALSFLSFPYCPPPIAHFHGTSLLRTAYTHAHTHTHTHTHTQVHADAAGGARGEGVLRRVQHRPQHRRHVRRG